jgi:hypothetical protein
MNNIVIVGCGRSGTTALAKILNSHPDILSTNELGTWNDSNGSMASARLRDRNNKVFRFLEYKTIIKNEKDVRTIQFRNINEKLIRSKADEKDLVSDEIIKLFLENTKPEVKYYCDKGPFYTKHMEEVVNYANNPKIIFCLRDPRDVLCSQVKRYKRAIENNLHLAYWMKPTIEDAIKSDYWLSDMREWDKFVTKNQPNYYTMQFKDIVNVKKRSLLAKEIAKYLDVSTNDMLDSFGNTVCITEGLEQWKTMYPNLTLPTEYMELYNKYAK